MSTLGALLAVDLKTAAADVVGRQSANFYVRMYSTIQ